jgi:catechol 2,3-dioxygenase-like lactoylglutathione lyase family enzyme
MSSKGFSNIGLSTLDLDKTRAFYEGVLGFKPVVSDMLRSRKGATFGTSSSMSGRDQFIAFLEANQVPDMPTTYNAGINRGLGFPRPSIISPSRAAHSRPIRQARRRGGCTFRLPRLPGVLSSHGQASRKENWPLVPRHHGASVNLR